MSFDEADDKACCSWLVLVGHGASERGVAKAGQVRTGMKQGRPQEGLEKDVRLAPMIEVHGQHVRLAGIITAQAVDFVLHFPSAPKDMVNPRPYPSMYELMPVVQILVAEDMPYRLDGRTPQIYYPSHSNATLDKIWSGRAYEFQPFTLQ